MDTDERQISVDDFYHLNGKTSSNSDVHLWRFWRDVALRLGKLEFQRAASARRVAHYVWVIRRAAEERDKMYRAKIEALKAVGYQRATSRAESKAEDGTPPHNQRVSNVETGKGSKPAARRGA